MKKSDKLFILIKGLEKSEKRFFKIYSTRHVIGDQNKYVQLFDFIDKQKVYNETAILKKFAQEKFINRLAVAKSYLYDLILKSMNNYHTQHSLDAQIRERLGHVSFLYYKGLDEQALKILLKIKKLALTYEQFVFIPEILHWQKKIIEAQLYSQYPPSLLQHIHEEEKIWLKKLQNLNDYWLLQAELYYQYYQQGFQQLPQNELLNHPLLLDENNMLTTQARLLAYKTRATYYFLQRDIKQCYTYSKQIIDLLEEKPKLIEVDAVLYVSSINNLLNMSNMLQKQAEKKYYLKQLQAMRNNKKWRTWSQLQLKLFEVYYYHQMATHVSDANFEAGLPLVASLKSQLTQYEGKMKQMGIVMLCFYSFHICFGANQFSQAYYWINRIINYPAHQVRQDIYLFSKILGLLTVYELQQPLLLKKTIISIYKFLWKKEKAYALESLLLAILNKIPSFTTQEAFIQELKIIQQEVQKWKEDKHESRIFAYFPFNNWLASKINNQTFSQTFA